ncbi:MAG: sugar ABC transporter ATP-binding protein [Verrucomicrobiota bacterium]|nr:sugar ABC transporter ATP-binding protein [Verrucomicrobiota bacterium]
MIFDPSNPPVSGRKASDGPVLRMEGISKSFSGVAALDNVSLQVARGEVHALMGENGAGKSTLMKILSGIVERDRGEICLDGEPVEIRTPKEALRLGISMIHQELNPVRAMTVSENLFLGREPCYRFTNVVNRRRQRELTRSLLREMDISLNPDARMRDLSVSQMQLVEIVKAVSYNARIIIMDEPTSAITGREVEKLFEIIGSLKSRGIAVIYISHKMDEVFRIADSVTVLRDGQYIGTRPSGQLDHDTLVRLMVGRELSQLFPRITPRKGSVSLEVEGLSKRGKFQDISFRARRGEVLGFAGLMGAGRSEIMETLFGMHRADAGIVKMDGREVHIHSPADAVRCRMALITEDRQLKGLNLKASVKANLTLVSLKKFSRFGQILQPGRESRAADAEIEKFRIKTRDRNQAVNTLSGGNQQKVVLAKWLLGDPEIVILDEPTRGIDIGAKAEIYRIIGQLAEQGKTILMVSSELPEILGLCDRVVVLCHGRINGEFERRQFDPERILKAAMGNGGGGAKSGNN